MKFIDLFRMAFGSIGRNKVRSFLTALGIIIGVASVIAMVHLGQAATLSVTQQIQSMGSNLLMVRPGSDVRGRTPCHGDELRDGGCRGVAAGTVRRRGGARCR